MPANKKKVEEAKYIVEESEDPLEEDPLRGTEKV